MIGEQQYSQSTLALINRYRWYERSKLKAQMHGNPPIPPFTQHRDQLLQPFSSNPTRNSLDFFSEGFAASDCLESLQYRFYWTTKINTTNLWTSTSWLRQWNQKSWFINSTKTPALSDVTPVWQKRFNSYLLTPHLRRYRSSPNNISTLEKHNDTNCICTKKYFKFPSCTIMSLAKQRRQRWGCNLFIFKQFSAVQTTNNYLKCYNYTEPPQAKLSEAAETIFPHWRQQHSHHDSTLLLLFKRTESRPKTQNQQLQIQVQWSQAIQMPASK